MAVIFTLMLEGSRGSLVLQHAAASSTIPPHVSRTHHMAMRAPQDVSPQTLELSRYISSALRKPIPRDVTERAKIHLVDTFAAMISGSRLLPGKTATAYVRTLGGKPESGVVG